MNKSVKYTLYIGSVITTSELDITKILKEITSFFDAYTYQTASGMWKGKQEKTFRVEIVTDDRDRVHKLVE